MFGCGVIHEHPAATVAIGMWLLNCIAGSLQRPDKSDPKSYKFLFAFVHAVTGSLPRIAATMLPVQWARFFLVSPAADAQAAEPPAQEPKAAPEAKGEQHEK